MGELSPVSVPKNHNNTTTITTSAVTDGDAFRLRGGGNTEGNRQQQPPQDNTEVNHSMIQQQIQHSHLLYHQTAQQAPMSYHPPMSYPHPPMFFPHLPIPPPPTQAVPLQPSSVKDMLDLANYIPINPSAPLRLPPHTCSPEQQGSSKKTRNYYAYGPPPPYGMPQQSIMWQQQQYLPPQYQRASPNLPMHYSPYPQASMQFHQPPQPYQQVPPPPHLPSRGPANIQNGPLICQPAPKGNQTDKQRRSRLKCTVPDCPNQVVQGGLCISHGAKRKICSHPGCTKNIKKLGLCSAHGPARKKCEFDGCVKIAIQGGRCIAHGAKKGVGRSGGRPKSQSCVQKVTGIQAILGSAKKMKYSPKKKKCGKCSEDKHYSSYTRKQWRVTEDDERECRVCTNNALLEREKAKISELQEDHLLCCQFINSDGHCEGDASKNYSDVDDGWRPLRCSVAHHLNGYELLGHARGSVKNDDSAGDGSLQYLVGGDDEYDPDDPGVPPPPPPAVEQQAANLPQFQYPTFVQLSPGMNGAVNDATLLNGKTFVITGNFRVSPSNISHNHDAITEMIKSFGGQVLDYIPSCECKYLSVVHPSVVITIVQTIHSQMFRLSS